MKLKGSTVASLVAGTLVVATPGAAYASSVTRNFSLEGNPAGGYQRANSSSTDWSMPAEDNGYFITDVTTCASGENYNARLRRNRSFQPDVTEASHGPAPFCGVQQQSRPSWSSGTYHFDIQIYHFANGWMNVQWY